MKKFPIIDEKDLNALMAQALNGNGTLTTPTEISQMLRNIPGVCIYSKPRKDGRYQGYILDKGERTYAYGKTREEVAIKLRFFIKHGIPEKKKKQDTYSSIPQTFNAFTMYYFDNFRRKTVSPYTLKKDLQRYNCHIKPYFAEKPIKNITPLDCQTLIETLDNAGKHKTAEEVFSLLSVIFKMAIRHNVITKNPLDIVFRIPHERKHGSALSKEEETTLKTALSNSKYLPALMLALYTGLRPNELTTAKIDGDFIIAVNSKRKNKNVEYKRIPISKMLAPYLTQPLIIPRIQTLRDKIKAVLPGHILYDLRTTFYTRCKECGINQYAINAFMGHSLGALGNAYTDLPDEYLKKEMSKLDY